MRSYGPVLGLVVLIVASVVSFAQTPAALPTSAASIPRIIRFAGVARNADGTARAGVVGVTFHLYTDETGGTPLWQELQNVTVDAGGHYSVLLGANFKDGIPAELFTSNEARWLGAQVEQEPEQARVLLVSVPYALKAGDAERVGGHPLSDFVMTAASNVSGSSSGSTGSASPTAKSSVTSSAVNSPLAGSVGAGSLNAIAKYDGSGNLLGSSMVFDTGAALGVGTQSPAAALDVNSTTAPASGITPFAFRAINAMTVGQTNNFPQNNFSSVYSGTGTQGSVYGLVNQIQKTGTGPLTNAYGVLSSVQNNNPTGAITNAYAFVAQQPVTTGPITNSYGFYAEDPNSINYFAGKVGIGTNTPQAGLDISNISAPASGVSPNGFRAVGNITVGQTNNFPQNNFSSVYSGTGTQGFIYGLVNQIQKTGTGPLTNAYGVVSSVQNNNATGVITNAYAFVAQQPVTTGPITNSYGFYAEDPNSTNFFAGKVGIGTVTPGQKLSVAGMVESTSGGFKFPDGSTLTSAVNNFTQTSYTSSTTDQVIHATQNGAGAGSLTLATLPAAIRGDSSATSNFTSGILGTSSSGSGFGVVGENFASTGYAIGVFGVSTQSANATGVWGEAQGNGTDAVGVYGKSPGTAGTGVTGYASATTGDTAGVYGRTDSTFGMGVFGDSRATSGNTFGVLGRVASGSGAAGVFDNTAAGNILLGRTGTNPVNVFRVDGTGRGFFNGNVQVGGADFAESFEVVGTKSTYGAGDLLIIDQTKDRRLALSYEPYSTLVAGIYSTKPGVLATPHDITSTQVDAEVPLAVVGIVPCKASAENGRIHRGDLLVSSSIAGHVMKGTDRSRMLGAVVGKALSNLDSGTGIIQVLVTLQ